MGFLGVAGIAIIAVYVFAQGRRSRAKEASEPTADAELAASDLTETSTAAQPTGTRGE
ncbi:MAG TPA: hypothetical protein VF493_21465 [Terriglobales bacterium]